MDLYTTNNQPKIKVYEIAAKMRMSGLDDYFIANAVKIAEIYEGAYDLFCLWDEDDSIEKEKIISVLKAEIEEYKKQPKEPTKINV